MKIAFHRWLFLMSLLLSLHAPLPAQEAAAEDEPKPVDGVILKVPPSGLVREANLEVVFPQTMIPAATVGQSVEIAHVLDISPKLAGTFTWRSRYNGTFQPSEIPKLGGSYTLKLAASLKDTNGKSPSLSEPVVAPAPTLRVQVASPEWFSNGNREPELFYYFNDAIDLESVVSRAAFRDKKGEKSVPAVVHHALGRELLTNPPALGTYEEQFTGGVSFTKDQSVPSVVKFTPKQPLPPGEGWTLMVTHGVANSSKTAATPINWTSKIGNVLPMKFNAAEAVSPLDETRHLDLSFTKALPKVIPSGTLQRLIKLEPLLEDLKWEVQGSSVVVTGNFDIDVAYKINLQAGIISQDGLKTEEASEATVTFHPHEASVALAAFSNTQWLGGKRAFGLQSANNQKVQVQIKRVDPNNIVYALRGYHSYENDTSGGSGYTRIPYAAMPGKTSWQKDFPTEVEMDQSEHFSFTWDEALGGVRAGVYFVNVEGRPKQGVVESGRVGAQALVQLTDLGLAWKFSEKQAKIFAFSHTTGQPLKDVQIATFDDDANPLQSAPTNAEGLADVPMTDKSHWLVAVGNQDWHGIRFSRNMSSLGMWDFDVNYSGSGEDEGGSAKRDTLFFTDRPLYQPGETVYLKMITRQHSPEGLSFHSNREARLRGFDLNEQLFLEKKITFSESGTHSDIVKLPANGVGSYHFEVTFFKSEAQIKAEAEAKTMAAEDGEIDGGDNEEGSDGGDEEVVADVDEARVESTTEHYILVQEYQPNAFKITFEEEGIKAEGETRQVPVRAAYFMGKSLSDATLKWTSTLSQEGFYAEKFRDYAFCQARRYQAYDGDQWRELPREPWQTPLLTGQGELKLSAKGAAMIPGSAPESFGVVGPKQLRIEAEITDLNQQTIAGSLGHTMHSSEFYIGVRTARRAHYANADIPIEMVAVKTDGQRYDQPVVAKLLVERLVWNEVKVQTAGGGNDIRHDLTVKRISEQDITISPIIAKELVATLKLADAGTYSLTITATDAKGATVQTVSSFDVYGAQPQEGAWAQNEGIKIELTADKDSYQAGDVARIIVKSPFRGTALITVEREKVLKSWLTKVDGAGGAVEVPIDDSFAPNCFVSVLQVRGGVEDAKEINEPGYKMGLCELTVVSHAQDLKVEITPSQPEYRPGTPVTLTATVRDSAGQPVPKAEVALWAADDGILSLVNYQMPEVVGIFHYAQPLRVTTGISLMDLLSEDPAARDYTNKGFVIGGGGEGAEGGEALRKEFKALAYWNPALITDAAGKVTVTFNAPDSLTQYRLQAIVSEGASRFGSAENRFKVNKPLMLEPSMPRFANVGDEIMLKAVLHNATQAAADLDVTLQIDDHLQFPQSQEEHSASKSIQLSAGQSKAALFPVRFVKTGTATFKWKAVAKNGAPEMTDGVQTTLEIGTTEPILRDIRFLNVGEAGAGKNLLQTLSPELLDAPATIHLVMSNNRIVEAAGAIEQLLHYPYGCVEQTSSALLPWLALKDISKAVPSLSKPPEQIATVIQKGVDRLLSMQTPDGGLAYWPGGGESLQWASAQGGMALVLAIQAGASVPQVRMQRLLRYLSKSLRTERNAANPMDDYSACFACYTLALAGKAEPSYHEVLFQNRAALTTSAKNMLALAIAEAKGEATMAEGLLAEVKGAAKDWAWIGNESKDALQALAWMKLGNQAKASKALEQLLEHRSPRGDWKNTFNNGWVVTAVAAQAKTQNPWAANEPATLTFNGQEHAVSFGPEPGSQSLTFTTAGGGALPTLMLKVPAGRRLYGKMEISARASKNLEEGRAAGFALARSYQKVDAQGAAQPGEPMKVGDLVLVSLQIDVPGDSEYLAIDDPLPATLEGVNPEFATMAANPRAGLWTYDHQEMRRDRILYFRDSFSGSGRFHMQYLARVVAEGTVTAPAARIEAMYDPAQFGLCPAEKLTTLAGDEKDVAGK